MELKSRYVYMSFNIVSKMKIDFRLLVFRNLMVHGKYTAVRAGQNCQLLTFQGRVMDPRAQATLFGLFVAVWNT